MGDLAVLLNVVDPGRRLILCGLSEGRWTAYVYAAFNRGRVDGVIVIDVGPKLNAAGTRRVLTEADDTGRPALRTALRRILSCGPRTQPGQLPSVAGLLWLRRNTWRPVEGNA